MKPATREGKILGYALPLLSARTGSGPCGEFPDIAAMADLAARWGMDMIQILPVNDTGTQTSPYSALSAFALNPIYLRIGDLPEIVGPRRDTGSGRLAEACREDAAALACAHRNDGRVRYAEILDAKMLILRRLWEGCLNLPGQGKALMDSVRAWAEARSWVRPFACFSYRKAEEGGLPWWEWKKDANPSTELVDALWNRADLGPELLFWAWLQKRCSEQFASACALAKARGVEIMGDIPILLNADSAEVWHQRDLFDLEASAGAPPDMYSAFGQNWGFPLYRWDSIAADGYRFWKDRLAEADAYYSYYRIDHVLGFFRIWAIGKSELDGYLGRFEPERRLDYTDLLALGFDSGRIRWLSRPHVPGQAIRAALAEFGETKARSAQAALFEQIGDEDLYLFSPSIRGGKDIVSLIDSPGSPAEATLLSWWRNRCLVEVRPGKFASAWNYEESTAWRSLSDGERVALGGLIGRRKAESFALWERTGRKILGALASSVEMRPCAEDLGAVPPCVPTVLGELGIPGLRVLRWHRDYASPGSPYIPLADYPEDSVACTSVHDSSSLRQWWIEEAEREKVWELVRYAGGPLAQADAPTDLDPESALHILSAVAASSSRIVVFPLQDLLAASERHRDPDPALERINVPGTSSPTNWAYRTKPSLEELAQDEEFARRMRSLRRPRRV
ncbi:MAG TPA: 4-alpha-glucanotransferase [Rectinemataceae bacterium]